MLTLCHIRTEGNTLIIYRDKHHHLRTIYQCRLFDRLHHKHIDRQQEIFMIRTAANLISLHLQCKRENGNASCVYHPVMMATDSYPTFY